ncbi:MAG: hypothetical protein R3336_02495 [Phycisphaeraceae bacterium]|nr:hypothetical protein [Phycisphaeraceae bacterium]
MVVTLDLTWRDVRSNRILTDRSGLQVVAAHIPSRPVGEPLEVGRHEVIERAAERIVSLMRSAW